jgi:erythrocyte band 7 integral membrane protein
MNRSQRVVCHPLVDVDSVICWHVVSPYRAAFGIADVRTALVERAREL